MRNRAATEDAQPLTIPTELWARPVEIPIEWIATPPTVSLLDKLLPLLGLICGYTSALAGSRHAGALASLLFLGAFLCVLRLGYAAGRYAQQALRFYRSATQR